MVKAMTTWTKAAVLATALLLLPQLATAAIGNVLHFEGRLLSAAGTPAPDGDYGVTVRFYADKTDAAEKAVYTYSDTGVKTVGGLFSISIGSKAQGGQIDTTPFTDAVAAWIGIQVGSDPELPRLRLHKVPYALRAEVAGTVQCTGCIGAGHLAADALKDFAKTAELAKVAVSGSWKDIQDKPKLPPLNTCPVGHVLAGYKIDGSSVCVPDQDTKTIYAAGEGLKLDKDSFLLDLPFTDARWVNEGQEGAINSAMLKDGQVKAVDVDSSEVQRRVVNDCPAGHAIGAIAASGKPTCLPEVGPDAFKIIGKGVKGNWHRVAATKGNGHALAGTFSLYDSSFNSSLKFRVAISRGFEAGMSVQLLGHSREATLVFEKIRVLENSDKTAHFVDVKFAQNADVWFHIEDNRHKQAWIADAWTIKGINDPVAGFSARIYAADKLAMVGDSVDRLSVDRGGVVHVQNAIRGDQKGALRVSSGTGYIDVGPKDDKMAHLETDRAFFYLNKELRVNSGAVGSYDEDLLLRTKGTTRMQVSQATGHVGVGVAPDATYRLKVNGSSHAAGNVIATGVVRADKGVQVDGNTVIDDGGAWHRSYGKAGWFNHTYGGGIFMEDSTWVKIYGSKKFWATSDARVEGYLGIGTTAAHPLHVTKAIAKNWSAKLTNGTVNVYAAHADGHGLHVNNGAADSSARYLMDLRTKAGSAMYVRGDRRVGINNSSPSYTLDVAGSTRLDGNVGINTAPRSDSYRLSMGGHIHMNNHAIKYVTELHFNDNFRIYDEGNDNYLNFRYGDTGTGAIRFLDGSGYTQGYLFADGHNSNASFGLRDADNNWAVRVYDDQYTSLYRNGAERLRADSVGVKVYGTLEVSACPSGMTKSSRLCYTGNRGPQNLAAAQTDCAKTFGGHICNWGEFNVSGLPKYPNTVYYWIGESNCNVGTASRYRNWYSWQQQWQCASLTTKTDYRCCRGL